MASKAPEIPTLDFRTLFQSVPDPCLVLGDFLIVWANPAFFEATLTTPADTLEHNLFEVFPDNPYDPNAAGVRKLKTSLMRVLQHRRVDAAGLVKYDLPVTPQKDAFEERYGTPVNIPVFGGDNEISDIILHTKDVTPWVLEKRWASGELKRMLDGIPDMAWMKDAEGRFIWVNRPYAEACAIDAEDLIGKTDMDAWPAELAAKYMADDAEVIRSRQRKWYEEPLVSANGDKVWIETVKTAYDSRGEIIGSIDHCPRHHATETH